ncbi:unnamed protein product [Prorocentrum cordatum]|uniref:Mei2-like C-terminal RNA recognition motif domain-containing protein n=1 Tax=Prorocentrum cordatum TaxID=2364126 RepID=A0ABN9UB47_9DINO|nr:unnamed protein product [Polarella glacialis]
MSVTQRDLLDLIDRAGFENRYDYAYMPTTFDSGTTRGISFVNFATSSDAREFSVLWNGSRLTGVAGAGTSGTVIEVTASATQGYSENAGIRKASRLRRIRNPKFHVSPLHRPEASCLMNARLTFSLDVRGVGDGGARGRPRRTRTRTRAPRSAPRSAPVGGDGPSPPRAAPLAGSPARPRDQGGPCAERDVFSALA